MGTEPLLLPSDVVRELRRPLPPESVGFKLLKNPQARGGKWSNGQVAGFHDARSVVERLNRVMPGQWSDEYAVPPVGQGLMCRLTVGDVSRCDVGFSANLATDMGVKALYSDAFKRAGVKFGVGVFLYAIPRLYVNVSQLKNFGSDQAPKWFMPDQTVTHLRGQYAQWLHTDGGRDFGDPLGHGDAPNPQGDVESTDDQSVPDDPEPEAKPDVLEHIRAAIRAKDRKALPDVEWAAMRGMVNGKADATALWKLLATQYDEAGGDSAALLANFKAQVA